jgi:hypothetical protein
LSPLTAAEPAQPVSAMARRKTDRCMGRIDARPASKLYIPSEPWDAVAV